MNLLDRAKALLQKKSALAAVPLAVALAASTAGAAPILPSSAPACQSSFTNLDACLVAGANTPGGGVTFFGGHAMAGSGGFGILRVVQSGLMNESVVGSVPVNYDFQLGLFDSGPRLLPLTEYSIQLQISQTGGQTFTQTITGNPANFTGFVVIPNVSLVAGLPTTTAIIMASPAPQGGVQLSFPNNGFITFGAPFPPEETAAPEPQSILLVGAGGLLVLVSGRGRALR